MKILCTDLDNTLIYSYKHDIGIQKRNVEIYQGREISYITDKTYDLLKKVKKEYKFFTFLIEKCIFVNDVRLNF